MNINLRVSRINKILVSCVAKFTKFGIDCDNMKKLLVIKRKEHALLILLGRNTDNVVNEIMSLKIEEEGLYRVTRHFQMKWNKYAQQKHQLVIGGNNESK